jgi:integrase
MNEVITIEDTLDFHIRDLEMRKRKPAKVSTLATFRSYRKWIEPIAKLQVEQFNNASLRDFVSYLSSNNLSPKTIGEVAGLVKSAIASVVDEHTGDRKFDRTWNSKFIDAPEIKLQRQPIVTAKELEDAIKAAMNVGQTRDAVLWALAAGSGARIGELRGLRIGLNETSSYWSPDESALVIRTAFWRGIEQTPKSEAGNRTIEIAGTLNDAVKEFVASRSAKHGEYLFANVATRRPVDVSNLRRALDARLPGKGFHSLRRFRTTSLRSKQVPEDLVRYWVGHSTSSITDRYSKLSSDTIIRRAEADRCGLGFDLPAL